MASCFMSQAATIFLLTSIIRHGVARNNVTSKMFHKQIPTPAPLMGQLPPEVGGVSSTEEDLTSSEGQLTSLLKFHVSGELDSGFVEMAKSFKGNPQLNNLSTMLDAKLTNLFREKKIHDVQIDSVRSNGATYSFTATLYFDTDAHVRHTLITKLLEEDRELEITVIYVYEYCSDSTCNGRNGECDFNGGEAVCTCMSGFSGDRCRSKTYPDKDYFMAGTICGVIFAIIVALLVVFCRTYRYHTHPDSIATSEGSSVGTTNSSNGRYSSCQEVYVKKPYESGFLTYKNIATTKPGAGIVNRAFVIDSASQRKLTESDRNSSSEGDTIYKKQLRKFFEDAPQMRLNETLVSGDNSFTEIETKVVRGVTGTGKTMNSYAPPPSHTPRAMVLNSSSRREHKHIS